MAYKTNIDFVAVVVVVVAAAALLLLVLLLRLFMLMELPLLMVLLLLVAQPQLMVLGNAVVPLTAAAGQNFAAHVLSCLTRICILYARPAPVPCLPAAAPFLTAPGIACSFPDSSPTPPALTSPAS